MNGPSSLALVFLVSRLLPPGWPLLKFSLRSPHHAEVVIAIGLALLLLFLGVEGSKRGLSMRGAKGVLLQGYAGFLLGLAVSLAWMSTYLGLFLLVGVAS